VVALPSGGGFTFVDPSTPALPVGRLPGALQGQKGLLVRPALDGKAERGGELITLPEDSAGENVIRVELDLELRLDGTVDGAARATLTGVDAARARALLADRVTAPKTLRALLFGDAAGVPDLPSLLSFAEVFEVTGAKGNGAPGAGSKDVPEDDRPLRLQLRAEPLPARDRERPLEVTAERLVGRPLPFLWRERRQAPVVLDHRGVTEVKLALRLPAGHGVDALPASLSKKGSVFQVDERWAVADGVLWLSRTLRTDERVVPPERYDELRAAATALWARQQQVVRVVPGGDRGAVYKGDPF
jgi:hypothetical protein